MDRPIRSAITFFGEKYERILLLILFILLPIIAVQFLAANYILTATPAYDSIFSIADVYNAFIALTFFILGMIPFVYFFHNEEKGADKPLRLAFFQFALKGFHFFVFAAIVSLMVIIGFSLFFLPGLILFAMFICAPIIAVADEQSVWSSVKESIRIFKAQWWKIIGLIVAFGLVELIMSNILLFLIVNITTSFLAIAICQVFLNTVFLPLFYLILASLTTKWREELSLFSIDKTETLIAD